MRGFNVKPDLNIVFSALLFLIISLSSPVAAKDRLLVLPFENRSQQAEYNWVRDSFTITLGEVISRSEIVVVPFNERDLAYERLRLSTQDLLTRASMLRVAEAAQAQLALVGEFDIGGEKDGVTISVAARLIDVSAGRLVANKVFNFSGPLADLQPIQAQLAWRVVYQRDPSIADTKEQFVQRLAPVPPLAFESFIKGVQTTDLKRREAYLRRAIREYGGDGAGGYGAALYELGLLAYRRGDDAESAKSLRQIDVRDPRYEAGLFYLGLAAFRLAEYQQMTDALQELSRRRPVPAVLNNLAVGYLAKGEVARSLPLLQQVVANRPEDTLCRFNFAYALWRSEQHEEAIGQFRAVLEQIPQDGEVLFMLSRSLRVTGREGEAAGYDNEARRYLPGYARWTVEPTAIPMLGRVSHDFDLTAEEVKASPGGGIGPSGQLRQRLDAVRRMLAVNDDEAATRELEQLDQPAAGGGEVAYLRGLIYQRRGEVEAALTWLRTAVARDPQLFEAHLLLSRIYWGRNDRARATTHVKQALAIDPASREAVTLKQRIESGR